MGDLGENGFIVQGIVKGGMTVNSHRGSRALFNETILQNYFREYPCSSYTISIMNAGTPTQE